MKPIESKIDILQSIAKNITGLLKGIQVTRKTAEKEIAGEGLTPETCLAMATLMAQLHQDTAALHNGGHSIHQSMAKYAPEPDPNSFTIQSGNKTWPPSP